MAKTSRRTTKRTGETTDTLLVRAAAPARAAAGVSAKPTAGVSSGSAEAETTSGLYVEVAPNRGELRLDVDGAHPQMMVSGVVASGIANRLHWIARIAPTSAVNSWSGDIWYKDGVAALLPHTRVDVSVALTGGQREASVRFSGGATDVTRVYRRRSAFFHPVEFEYDVVDGTASTTAIDTCAHPNRPADLPCERLSIETVFRRAGFDVSLSPGGGVPLGLAGANRTWSNTEMHDAMQTFWSRFQSAAQWSFWVLFAARHDDGATLGGIMFDDIGSQQRQGTAVFNDTFIAEPPAGDPAPAAWVERMRFWTACHEMGHSFNLAHSWQKALSGGWIPINNEPEVRSFMNYPFRVAGGQSAFFADFAYRFSDQELLFMRHAPERFVQMGNALWFDDHGFEQAETSPEPKFRVEIRVNRTKPVFEFLEPCMLEIKLTNISGDPQIVGEQALRAADHLMVIIKKDGAPARQWLPFAQYCYKAKRVVIEPGASRYESLFVGAGRNGWDLAEPGLYTVQMSMRIANEDCVSNPLRIKVLPPRSYDQEALAQDLFVDDVGRVLAFDGSRVLDRANDVLREAATQFADHPVARHALIALGRPHMTEGKVLSLPAGGPAAMAGASASGGAIAVTKAQSSKGEKELTAALLEKPQQSAETLGHIDYKSYADTFSDNLANAGEKKMADKVQAELYTTLAARKVAPQVLADIKEKRAQMSA